MSIQVNTESIQQSIINKLARVAETGSYNDLSDTPQIPNADAVAIRAVSMLPKIAQTGKFSDLDGIANILQQNDVASRQYIEDIANDVISRNNLDAVKPIAYSGSYNDLTDKPDIPSTTTLQNAVVNQLKEMAKSGMLSDAIDFENLSSYILEDDGINQHISQSIEEKVEQTIQAYETPIAGFDNVGGIKTGFNQTDTKFPVQLDADNRAYVEVNMTTNNDGQPIVIPINPATGVQLGGIMTSYMSNDESEFPVKTDVDGNAYVKLQNASNDRPGIVQLGFEQTDGKYPVNSQENKLYVDLSKLSDSAILQNAITKITEDKTQKLQERIEEVNTSVNSNFEYSNKALSQFAKTTTDNAVYTDFVNNNDSKIKSLLRKEHSNGVVEYKIRLHSFDDIQQIDSYRSILLPDAIDENTSIVNYSITTSTDFDQITGTNPNLMLVCKNDKFSKIQWTSYALLNPSASIYKDLELNLSIVAKKLSASKLQEMYLKNIGSFIAIFNNAINDANMFISKHAAITHNDNGILALTIQNGQLVNRTKLPIRFRFGFIANCNNKTNNDIVVSTYHTLNDYRLYNGTNDCEYNIDDIVYMAGSSTQFITLLPNDSINVNGVKLWQTSGTSTKISFFIETYDNRTDQTNYGKLNFNYNDIILSVTEVI